MTEWVVTWLRSALLLTVASVSWAQSHGYVFAGPGAVSVRGNSDGRLFLGGGAEGVFRNGFGIGGELGYSTPWERFGGGIGVASLNGSYHFARNRGALDPFVTGGYTLLFRDGHVNAFNLGGGINYWLSSKFGLKLEFRDHIDPSDNITVHLWSVRFGLTFR